MQIRYLKIPKPCCCCYCCLFSTFCTFCNAIYTSAQLSYNRYSTMLQLVPFLFSATFYSFFTFSLQLVALPPYLSDSCLEVNAIIPPRWYGCNLLHSSALLFCISWNGNTFTLQSYDTLGQGFFALSSYCNETPSWSLTLEIWIMEVDSWDTVSQKHKCSCFLTFIWAYRA